MAHSSSGNRTPAARLGTEVRILYGLLIKTLACSSSGQSLSEERELETIPVVEGLGPLHLLVVTGVRIPYTLLILWKKLYNITEKLIHFLK